MKYIFTLITPEGKEVIIGAYEKESTARAVVVRKFPADWRGLCSYPMQQRALREGETVTMGEEWTSDR